MNIPLGRHAPALFNPSNVLCSSTPTRHKASSRMSDITLDPSETPIKGHGVRRKTVAKSISKSSSRVNVSSPKPSSVKLSRDTAGKVSVTRHKATPTNAENALARAASANESHSSSEQTDQSDSNNITEAAKNKQGRSKTGAIVSHSQDTDNDFPTTDFNNDAENLPNMNDLNKTGGKHGKAGEMGQTAFAPSAVRGGVHLSTSGHPLPVVDISDDATRASVSIAPGALTKAKPMIRPKVYDSQNNPFSSDIGRVDEPPERDYSDLRPSQPNMLSNPTTNRRPAPITREFDDSDNTFNDDLLFQSAGLMPSVPKPPPQRRPSNENSLLSSRGQNTHPLKLPQDPSMKPLIPVVQTAISSDLTTFSNTRSPRRFMQTPEVSKAPVKPSPLQYDMIDPTISRPKIPRTPPPVEPLEQFSFNEHSENSDNDNSDPQVYDTPPIQRYPTLKLKMPHGNTRMEKREEHHQSSSSSEQEQSLLSTDHWYYTPANLDAHVGASVQKVSSSRQSDLQDTHPPPVVPKNAFEDEETDLKKLDCDLSEFIPFQRTSSIGKNERNSVLQASRQDVASRLKSVFQKEPATSYTSSTKLPGSNPNNFSASKHVAGISNFSMDQNNSNSFKIPSSFAFSSAVTTNQQVVGVSNFSMNSNPFQSHSSTSATISSDYFAQHNIPSKPVSEMYTKQTSREDDKPLLLQGIKFDSNERTIPALLDPNNKENINYTNSPTFAHQPKSPAAAAVNFPSHLNLPFASSAPKQAVLTEKLSTGSAFSPIHPQPVTSNGQKVSAAISKDLVQPTPKQSERSSERSAERSAEKSPQDPPEKDLNPQ